MSCNASAPCTTVWACRANRSKNRSSFGKKARNQRSISTIHRSGTASTGLSQNCHRAFKGRARNGRPPGNRVIHRFVALKKAPEQAVSERTPEIMGDLADHAAAEGQH